MDSFDELAKRLHALGESVAIAAPKNGGSLRNELQWTFGPSDHSPHAVQYHQTISVRIDWPRMPIGPWISTFDGFNEIVALLDASPHIHKWISTRVSGPDAANVRATGLQLFVQEFVMGIMDETAWRVSSDRFLDAREKVRILLSEGRVYYYSIMFLYGLKVEQGIHLDGIDLRAPTREELLAAFNRGYSEGPDDAALSCGAVLAAREYVPIGATAQLPLRFSGLLWAIQLWTQRAVVDFATLQYSGWQRSVGASRRLGHLYVWMLPLPVLERGGEFGEFWQKTSTVFRETPAPLSIALRRLSTMINQERREDRLLDLCIILEALLQHKDDENQELSYRLSLRTAHFVGTDQASRVAIWEAVRAGYRLRSKIAHGNTASDSGGVEAELERIVFIALKNYAVRASAIPKNDVAKTIIRQLEEYMLERKD